MPNRRAITLWLVGVCLLILAMVTVGGVTRLTGSGLSITEWKPIMGAVPPMSETAWNEAFSKYREIPQFTLVNSAMTLEGFKFIFFWEYLHRLLGRVIGVAFFVPWLYFLLRRRFDRSLGRRLLAAFVLGGAQGVLGWYMVMSGLSERTSVSHYRLAAHLGLALLILAYLAWIVLDLEKPQVRGIGPVSRRIALGYLALLSLQIVYGAFTAGTGAGHLYSSFPTMHGHWLHPDVFLRSPAWTNLLENPAMIQFVHRMLGWLLFLGAFAIAATSLRRAADAWSRRALLALPIVVTLQFALGVATLVLHMPLALAAAHQLCACFVLLATVNLVYVSSAGAPRSTSTLRT